MDDLFNIDINYPVPGFRYLPFIISILINPLDFYLDTRDTLYQN